MSIFSKEGKDDLKRTLSRGMTFFQEESQETFNVICVGSNPSEKDRVLKQFGYSIGGDTRSRLEELSKPYIQLQVINRLWDLVESAKKFDYEIDSKFKDSLRTLDKYKNDFHSIKELTIKDFAQISSIVDDDAIVKVIQRINQIETHYFAK